MHKRITFRNMDTSDVMKEYANSQLAKIEKFLEHEPTPIYLDLVFEPTKIHEHHRIELRVKSANFDRVSNYEYQGEGFYDVLDRVIDVMYNDLCQDKQRLVDERKYVGRHEEYKKQK